MCEELRKHVYVKEKKLGVLKELNEKICSKKVIDADIDYYHKELDKIWKKFEEEKRLKSVQIILWLNAVV